MQITLDTYNLILNDAMLFEDRKGEGKVDRNNPIDEGLVGVL